MIELHYIILHFIFQNFQNLFFNELIAYQYNRYTDEANSVVRFRYYIQTKVYSTKTKLSAEYNIVQSMVRKSNYIDICGNGKFLWLHESGMFYGKNLENIEELESVIKKYVRYYNDDRIQLKLNGLSSIQYGIQPLK